MAGPGTVERALLVGATASDPVNSVVIWNHIRRYLAAHGLPIDYALYSTYDVLCGALLRGEVDIAWNAPMAHAQSLLVSEGRCRTLAMRDTDAQVATVIIARRESGITTPADLAGRRLALGVPIATELRLVPVHGLARQGIDVESACTLVDLEPREYSNGQRWVDDFQIFDAVKDGTADAGAIFEPWLAHLIAKRGMQPEDLTIVWRSAPFCHCAFTARPGLPAEVGDRFVELLVAMDPASDPAVADMMQREHLTRWLPASDEGWQDVMAAIDAAGLRGATFI